MSVPPAGDPARGKLRVRLLALGRLLVLTLVLVAVGVAVYRDGNAVRATLARLSPVTLTLALALALVGLTATALTWRQLLAGLGSPLRVPHAGQVFLTGQLARYLPGSLWAFLLQAQLAQRHHVPRARSLLTVLLAAGVVTVTGLTLAVAAVPALVVAWGPVAWLLLAGPLSLIFLTPRLLTAVSNLALRVLRQPRLTAPIPGRAIALAALWALGSWLSYGAQLWVLAAAVGGVGVGDLPLITATFALAVCAGFVAFVLPSGVGVREAVLVVGLSPVVSPGAALALALVSRLMCTTADVVGAAGASVASRLTDRPRSRAGEQR